MQAELDIIAIMSEQGKEKTPQEQLKLEESFQITFLTISSNFASTMKIKSVLRLKILIMYFFL